MSRIGHNFPKAGPYSRVSPAQWRAATFPLGAHRRGTGATFAVFSKRAEHVLLEIYDTYAGTDARYDYWMVQSPVDYVWRVWLDEVPEHAAYGFRCWGPNWRFDANWVRGGCPAGFIADVDADGNRFNPNKVLFDPYARELSHDKNSRALEIAGLDERLFNTGGEVVFGRPQRELDSGHWAPKGLLIEPQGDSGARPRLPKENTVIYEAHLRGLTRHPSSAELPALLSGYDGFDQVAGVPEQLRGTYAGAALMAPYLKALGVTVLELLPVHELDNEMNPDDAAGGNYWGYMTHGFFAPDRRYALDQFAGGPTREFKAMVQAFHDVGIEVYLDVVYNHSGEGGNWPGQDEHGAARKLPDVVSLSSLAGFDVAEYYVLDDDHFLVDGATGTGNQLNFSSKAAQRLVLDSLSYWIEQMGVDGFRFDLAVSLGRKPAEFPRGDWRAQKWFFPDHPLLVQIRALGAAHDVEMIAEAWDLWGYHVGNFPDHWGEWNGRYRDAVRSFLRSDPNTLEFIAMLNGDYEHFVEHGGPQHSINFVTAHDGFTLMDLVSYNNKENDQPWPFGPSNGGTDENLSWDSGGDRALRRQRLRNFWTVQLFSRGVPLVVAGDEFGRTQNGNNNPYNIDGVGTWLNYRMLGTNHPTAVPTEGEGAYHDNFGTANCAAEVNPLFVFVTHLLRLRARSPSLRQRKYADFVMDAGEDVTYLFKRPNGRDDVCAGEHCIWLQIDGSEVGDCDYLLFINMHWEPALFTIPPTATHQHWVRIADTAGWAEPQCNIWAAKVGAQLVGEYWVQPQSIVVLVERRQ